MHLKISLRSITPDDTRRAMEATMAELASVHRAMLEAIADKNKRKLTAIVAEIHDVEVLLSRLDQIGKEILPGDHQGIVMWLQTTQDQKNHLRSLRRQESVLSEVLNSKLTVPTAAVEPVVVSSSPVYPKARKAWMLAGIGGLLLGMLMVTLRALVGMKAERVFTRDRVDTDDHQACSPIANGVQK